MFKLACFLVFVLLSTAAQSSSDGNYLAGLIEATSNKAQRECSLEPSRCAYLKSQLTFLSEDLKSICDQAPSEACGPIKETLDYMELLQLKF
jgi:hypothetical protein